MIKRSSYSEWRRAWTGGRLTGRLLGPGSSVLASTPRDKAQAAAGTALLASPQAEEPMFPQFGNIPGQKPTRRIEFRCKTVGRWGVTQALASGRGERITLAALFVGFLKVSLLGFGGGLVWARRIVVDQKRWVDDQEFAEILTLCQFMPGPNIVGITICVGSRLRGPVGAIAAVAGFILIPWTVGLAFGSLCLHYAQPPDPTKHPRRAFLGGRRPDDRDRDQAADAAPQASNGAPLCRPRLHRHGGRQAAAARRPAWLGAGQHRCRQHHKPKSKNIMKDPTASFVLAAHLALLSSISFGGFPTVLPDVRNLVTVNGWATDQEFANFFAISQVVPGPNMILMMSFVGLKVGIPGAITSAF